MKPRPPTTRSGRGLRSGAGSFRAAVQTTVHNYRTDLCVAIHDSLCVANDHSPTIPQDVTDTMWDGHDGQRIPQDLG